MATKKFDKNNKRNKGKHYPGRLESLIDILLDGFSILIIGVLAIIVIAIIFWSLFVW